MECTASAATKRLSWSWTMNRSRTRAAMPETTAKKALTFGGCRRTHVETAWIGLLCVLIEFCVLVFSFDFPGKCRRESEEKWKEKKKNLLMEVGVEN